MGDEIPISFPNEKCVETLKSSSAEAKLCETLVWQPNTVFLAWLDHANF